MLAYSQNPRTRSQLLVTKFKSRAKPLHLSSHSPALQNGYSFHSYFKDEVIPYSG